MVRNLYQQFYTQEETNDRDDAQQFRSFRGIKHDEYVSVPQLWILLLNSLMLITCDPKHLTQMGGTFLDTTSETVFLTEKAKLVEVIDFYKRVTYLPAGSFLALTTGIQEQVLSRGDEHVDQCILHWH